MQVIRGDLKKVEKEYNDLPEYAKLILDDPKLTDEDREKIQGDLDAYKIRYDDLVNMVTERDEAYVFSEFETVHIRKHFQSGRRWLFLVVRYDRTSLS